MDHGQTLAAIRQSGGHQSPMTTSGCNRLSALQHEPPATQRSGAPGEQSLQQSIEEMADSNGHSDNDANNNHTNSSSSCGAGSNDNMIRCNKGANQQNGEKRFRPQKFCSVCGDKAIACNFNAVTCESCKAFFRRNAYKEQRLKCLFDSCCLITKDTRRFCSKCRLLKCFNIGMKREWILTDEQKHSKRIKIIQNKESKRRQLASITAEQPEQQVFSSSAAAARLIQAGQRRYSGSTVGLTPLASGQSAPTSTTQLYGSASYNHLSEVSLASTICSRTTAARNSLGSNGEASTSRPDSCQGSDTTSHLMLPVASPPITLPREARAFVEMKDASTSTSSCAGASSTTDVKEDSDNNNVVNLTVMQQLNCSWSAQCHFCAMQLQSNLVFAPTCESARNLVHQRAPLSPSGKCGADFQEGTRPATGERLLTIGQVPQQQPRSPRMFYPVSAVAADTNHNGYEARKQLESCAAQVTCSYTNNANGANNHHLLHQLTGGAINRPVLGQCFDANANLQATNLHDNHLAPLSSVAVDCDCSAAPHYGGTNNNSMTTSSSSYLPATAEDSSSSSNNNNNGSSTSSSRCPLTSSSSAATAAGERGEQDPAAISQHHHVMSSQSVLSTCFSRTMPSSWEHFNLPAYCRTSTNFDCQLQDFALPMTKSSLNDLQSTTTTQQCHNLSTDRISEVAAAAALASVDN